MIGRTTPEQRASLFEDVEALLATGFLSTHVQVGRGTVALRTLHPWDVALLRARSEGKQDEAWKIRAVAAAVWLVDDLVVLGDAAAGHACISVVGNLSRSVVLQLFGVVLGLFARQAAAQEAVGVFVYEPRSRELWKMLGAQPWMASGIPGSTTMGSNWTQRWWVAFNEVEDERMRLEAQWEGFKLAASAQAPQAVKKIDDKDRGLREREQERRQSLLDQFFWHKAGVIDKEGYLRGSARWALGAKPLAAPKTTEDLVQEYKNWQGGVMDDHDRVVQAHKQAAMDRDRQAMEEERRALAAEVAAEQEAPDELVFRTAAEADALEEGRRRGTTWIPDVRMAAGRAYWQRRRSSGGEA